MTFLVQIYLGKLDYLNIFDLALLEMDNFLALSIALLFASEIRLIIHFFK